MLLCRIERFECGLQQGDNARGGIVVGKGNDFERRFHKTIPVDRYRGNRLGAGRMIAC
jgi:hypothetical protein